MFKRKHIKPTSIFMVAGAWIATWLRPGLTITDRIIESLVYLILIPISLYVLHKLSSFFSQ